MSGCHLPFHIQEEILKRLPVKSLVQFRSVSKAWKSLIESSQFIAAHSLGRHTQSQHLLVWYKDRGGKKKYICYTDDDTFPQQRPVLTPPLSFDQLKNISVVGSSHGLVCFYGYDSNSKTDIAVIWNPSITKSIVVAVPGKPRVGFGVCPKTHDPKIVSISQSPPNKLDIETKVMVYTLSSGKWRSLSKNHPTKPRFIWHAEVTTDRFIYWHALSPDLIMSFDVTNESFEVIDFPDTLATCDAGVVRISKVREALALVEYREFNWDVWMMMEHGDQRLFTKLYTVVGSVSVVGFRNSGIPIMNIMNVRDGNPYGDEERKQSKLVVYEPNSEHNNVLETSDKPYTIFHVHSYMETLILLGRSDCISH